MKVLFAVSNEEISESIVKKYQKEYKQIISYKNVYYFNAILKEIQKDKTYDRIVISEELEAFTHTQYEQIDKFIFDKLDSISDEASNTKGNDIPIILICSDRRTKSEQILIKLFGIGVYNAIIGNDRSVDEVCRLIYRPRVKKEAKAYYKIDVEEVNYQAENENDVSEMEIQNIVAHYKRLGKNEDKYVDSFNNIASQYNDIQLRIISKFLPLNVRAVLEEKSSKYQQIMSFNNSVSNTIRYTKEEEKHGPSEKLLTPKTREQILTKPVVIPSAVNMNGAKKLSRQKAVTEVQEEQRDLLQEIEEEIKEEVVQPVKRGRGRPKKNVTVEATAETEKRGRGRPRKIQVQEEAATLPGFDDLEEEEETTTLEGLFEELEKQEILPGLTQETVEEPVKDNQPEIATTLPGFEDDESETILPGINKEPINTSLSPIINKKSEEYESDIDLSKLLTSDKKIVSFVGTSKNGTSFIVNNVAQYIAQAGINVAILDTTRNRNSYYIYTKNEEQLRIVGKDSIRNLTQGIAQGISVNKNLTVYTSLPEEIEDMYKINEILETLLKNHTLILIDTDFDTPMGYFKESQETYLVQSLDILTIQPLTAFLRELKAKNILNEKKLRVILNKNVKIRGITDKTIIGGMSNYNDPAMSFMTELFDMNFMKYVSIPFEEETYIRYLEGIIQCDISLKGYSKYFMQTLKELANMVYTMYPKYGNREKSAFTPNMNNTLDQMKRNY